MAKEKPKPKPDGPITHCPECGHPLLNMSIGCICPEGHGGIHPHKVDPKIHAEAMRRIRISQLPEARRLSFCWRSLNGQAISRSLYRVEGRQGIWARVARTRTAMKSDSEGGIVAHDGGRVVELVRARRVEEEIGEAGFKEPAPF